MIPRDADDRLLEPGPVLRDAHEAGLRVTGWTFRRENRFLPLQLRSSADLDGVGDLTAELDAFVTAGHGRLLHRQPRHRQRGPDRCAAGLARPGPAAGPSPTVRLELVDRSPVAATIPG